MAAEHVQDPMAWLVPVLPERSLARDVYTSKGRSRNTSLAGTLQAPQCHHLMKENIVCPAGPPVASLPTPIASGSAIEGSGPDSSCWSS